MNTTIGSHKYMEFYFEALYILVKKIFVFKNYHHFFPLKN